MIPSGMDIVLCVSESEQPEVFELDALPSVLAESHIAKLAECG